MNWILMALFAALAVFDIVTTMKGLKMGGVEGSPIPAKLFKLFGPLPTMIALKLVGLAFLYYALFTLAPSEGANAFRWVAVAALFAAAVYVAVSNLRFIRANKP
jgi:uncharacterized membrane protein